ncbi:glutamate synthase subunit beta [Paremcibacter congregatus]|uniref:Glutamate synthase n=1 Tax=Paremcibacter congregatus TaxID=2043170 RepID=A0A2G4YQA5_9PROT|nr:glutamate synthase subunit beta [Paremcibacter congregatus]PHZ84499.1 glutamate synthase [Paremcibacter congregatus]QDE28718.1 glutamate synthase subunit beta [Paremcibacter congregatus]
MGKTTGFMELTRQERTYAPAGDRVRHYDEFVNPLSDSAVSRQGGRCMDCGIPFCHNGCPVNNMIPDWNDLVWKKDWQTACDTLHSTNNFPEFTGRICPAPCEAACTLNLDDQPVTIKTIECAIVDKGWEEGWIQPLPPRVKTGKKVAVVGSGPAGLSAAQQLARAGHDVSVYEKNRRPGGLLRYGIPDFKMAKSLIDRRVRQMEREGVTFWTSMAVGKDIPADRLAEHYDAVVLAGGSEQPRDLSIPGRELDGVHFAMDFLTQQNRRNAGEPLPNEKDILASGKKVIVIGGGDTGSDCVGTSFRQGAVSVTQIEIMPKPPAHENKDLTWPNWPMKLRTSTSQEEGADREWSVATAEFVAGPDGKLAALRCHEVDGNFQKIDGSEFELDAELVLLAMGFTNPVKEGMLEQLDVALDDRNNVRATTETYRTSVSNIFTAGDMRRGQSLVVWAIREGRQAARAVDEYLQGHSNLPR